MTCENITGMKIQNRKFMLIWMKTQCRQGAIPLRVLRAGVLLIEIKTILFSLTFHRPNPLICFQYLLEINPFVHIFFRSDNTITNQRWSFGNLVAGQIHSLTIHSPTSNNSIEILCSHACEPPRTPPITFTREKKDCSLGLKWANDLYFIGRIRT